MKEIKTYSPEETIDLGYRLGSLLKEGDIILLNGGLGAGKTAFASGIAKALGIEGYITSPTFTIVNEYKGRHDLYHFDVYRISDPEEMFEIGFEEYLHSNGILIIEWSDMIEEILPDQFIRIDIEKNLEEGQEARLIRLDFKGVHYEKLEKELR